MNSLPPIVVATPKFQEDAGGSIVLHFLVDRLRAMGADAFAHPLVPLIDTRIPSMFGSLHKNLRLINRRYRFKTHSKLDVPLAPKGLLRRSIAIYPEIVSGNPFGASMTVRWLLHKPGHFGIHIDRSSDDLTFAYGEAIVRSVDTAVDGILRLRWLRDDLYRQRQTGHRSGNALLTRKGSKDQNPNIRIPPDAIPVDGMSHEEMADVFNNCEHLYSCDPYTLLTYYAARCGCIPIIVPPLEMRKEDWHQKEEFRLGHAFGDTSDEIEFALRTRDALMRRVQKEKDDEERLLKDFLEIIERKYIHKLGLAV